VAIDWNDNVKRKVFREALQEAYPSASELEIFVDEELNENLEIVAGGANLKVTAHGLVKWAMAKGRLNDVYKAFKEQNSRHSVIEKLEQQSLALLKFNLTQDDWDTLFEQFLADDLADLHRAFQQGFQQALGFAFRDAQPQHPPLTTLIQIRELLEIHDTGSKGPLLAARFVECAISELQRSNANNQRNLTALEQWRDRIAQQHSVPPKPTEPTRTMACHAYLLVTLEVIGSDVNVYPELHITGTEKPVRFGAQPATCPVAEVADLISQWICQAEDALDDGTCDDGQVTLEVFLPYQHLEEDVANWSIKDHRGEGVCLGWHRRFLVRSSDRLRYGQIQRSLKLRWKKLEACVKAKNACDEFHLQEDCPHQKGFLRSLLDDQEALGLKFVAQLPTDPGKRTDLFKDIIDAAIPIALWSSEMADLDVAALKAEFDTLLKSCNLTNFADLAKHWRQKRRKSKHIRLLCDQPDRLPNLPDPDREEDLLVAS
jgi:hypothetical protein